MKTLQSITLLSNEKCKLIYSLPGNYNIYTIEVDGVPTYTVKIKNC